MARSGPCSVGRSASRRPSTVARRPGGIHMPRRHGGDRDAVWGQGPRQLLAERVQPGSPASTSAARPAEWPWWTATRSPCSAKAFAIARPMPPAAPVTKVARPLTRPTLTLDRQAAHNRSRCLPPTPAARGRRVAVSLSAGYGQKQTPLGAVEVDTLSVHWRTYDATAARQPSLETPATHHQHGHDVHPQELLRCEPPEQKLP